MNFRLMAKLAACVASSALFSVPAMAAPTYSGLNTVQYVVAYPSGLVTFTIGSAPESAWSTCNTNHQFTINTASTSGQAIYDVVIKAQQGVKNVYIVGTGSCTLRSGTEDVSYIQINP